MTYPQRRFIKGNYPNVHVAERRKAFFQLIRPYTILIPFLAVLFGALGSAMYAGLSPFSSDVMTVAMLAAMSMSVLQASGQVLNQATDDPRLDRENGKGYRPVCAGLITQREAFRASFGLAVLSLVLSMMIIPVNPLAGVRMMMALGIIVLIIVGYQVAIKPMLYVNAVLLALGRGLVPLVAIWLLFSPFDHVAVLLMWIFFWYVFGWQNTKDITDIEGDRRHGIRTIANVHGLHGLEVILILTTLVVWAHIIMLTVLDIRFALLNLVPLLSFRILFRGIDHPTRSMENVVGWVWFYLGLALMYILLPVSIALIGPFI